MSEQVDMVEVETEPNELFSVCKKTYMVANHLRQDEVTFESKNHISIMFSFKLCFISYLNFITILIDLIWVRYFVFVLKYCLLYVKT